MTCAGFTAVDFPSAARGPGLRRARLDHALRARAGASTACGRSFREFIPTLHAHVHLALLGWVTPMIFGVTARVYPMFLLAPEPAARLGRGAAVGAGRRRARPWSLGLLGAPGLLAPRGARPWRPRGGGHVAWCVIDRAAESGRGSTGASASRSPRRVPRSRSIRASGWPPLGILSGPRAALAYAVLALGGWISLTIAGMMLKIVPFLVWYRVYGAQAGRAPVPTLAQLSSPRAEGWRTRSSPREPPCWRWRPGWATRRGYGARASSSPSARSPSRRPWRTSSRHLVAHRSAPRVAPSAGLRVP